MILVAVALVAAPNLSPSGSPEPRVVATSPHVHAVIEPGPFELSVTFDRQMLDGSWSFVQVSPETFPNCAGRPKASSNARTFTWSCIATAGPNYEIWLNRRPYMNFRSIEKVPATPYRLVFTARRK